MSAFVIGYSVKLNGTTAVAVDTQGRILAEVQGKTCSTVNLSVSVAAKRVEELTNRLLKVFGGLREACKLAVVGAAGVDSPGTRLKTVEIFNAARLRCPIICVNDGVVVLHSTTAGVGLAAVCGIGSVVYGRNGEGCVARCGGYPITIHGDEGSARWIALKALHLASRWLDGCVPKTLLICSLNEYFGGLDIEKMTECARALRRQTIDPAISNMVFAAAEAGDEIAEKLLEDSAHELVEVALACAGKLGFEREKVFPVGMAGAVFENSAIFSRNYMEQLKQHYPNARPVITSESEGMCCARLALDYLNGDADYIGDM